MTPLRRRMIEDKSLHYLRLDHPPGGRAPTCGRQATRPKKLTRARRETRHPSIPPVWETRRPSIPPVWETRHPSIPSLGVCLHWCPMGRAEILGSFMPL
jgi:hypothetical protein